MEEVDVIKTRVVGVDIRETRTTYAVVNIRGEILAQDHFRTSDYPEISAYVNALSEKILTIIEENGGYESVRSVGISAPSANYLTGCIENAANMPWKGVIPLAAMLRDQLGLAVAVANDAHITALGEKAYGSAHGMKDFIVVSISHGGLGSCIFTNGLPHLGVNGFAGEVGHTCVEVEGRLCGCGLSELEDLSIATITSCCDKGDRVAIETFRRVGTMLGVGLANYASVINPEAIILTGDMMIAGKWLLKPMRAAFDDHVFHNIRGKVRILVSILKEGERDVLGASALAWDVKEYSLFKEVVHINKMGLWRNTNQRRESLE